MENIISTCFSASTAATRTIAAYSHIIPMVLALLLSIFVYIKSQKVLLSKILLFFTLTFSMWLFADVIIWTSNRFDLIYALWAPLDYLEIVFFILGLNFAVVFIRQSTMSVFAKICLFILTLPALYITLTLQSVTGFNYPTCEAFNNNFLGTYKLAAEAVILITILIYMFIPFIRKDSWGKKKASLIVLGSTFLFLSIFAVTEYLASVTGYYEMNLYSLFLLPVFLVAIIYSVFELDIFSFHLLGTHYLVVGLMVLTAGQLFFITSTTNRLLTILTVALTIGLSIILFRNLKRESDQRVQIEKLNVELESLLKQRESLVHLVTHKVKGSFTRSKYIFAGMLDGTFGEVNDEVKKRAQQGLESDNAGIDTVDLVLNAANLQKGTVKYDMKPTDFKDIVVKTVEEKKVQAEARGLAMETEIKEGTYNILGDVFWLKEAVSNLIENSIKYTKAGKISVKLENAGDSAQTGKILLSVKDTGVGITEEDKKNLFTEGGRGKDSVKVNVDSTGYGLYSVKLIIETHKGRVWAESEGAGKGSTFFIELPAA